MANATAPAITSSFQAECVVLTHMLREVRPDIPVLFLDTFHHFSQTLAYRDELSARWNLNLINLQAKAFECRVRRRRARSVLQASQGRAAFSALEGYDTWFTALRRDQSPSRANLQEIEPFNLPGKTISRVSPLAAWTARDVWSDATDHDIPAAGTSWATRVSAASVHGDSVRSRETRVGPLAGPEARMRHPHSGEINVSERRFSICFLIASISFMLPLS